VVSTKRPSRYSVYEICAGILECADDPRPQDITNNIHTTFGLLVGPERAVPDFEVKVGGADGLQDPSSKSIALFTVSNAIT
jgi:hypothetical protein